MSIESRYSFGKERLRMPEHIYDNHVIGDRCPLFATNEIVAPDSLRWWRLRYQRIVKGELKRLREYIVLNPEDSDSNADFEAGTTFDPNTYPHGTVILVGREIDLYTTTRTIVRKEEFRHPRGPVFGERPRFAPEWQDLGEWQEKEEYDDKRTFKGDSIGIVLKLTKTSNHTMLVQNSREDILKNKAGIIFLEGQLQIGTWSHIVTMVPQASYGLLNPNFRRSIQDDIFYHYTGVKILELGKGIKEKAKKPLELVSASLRRFSMGN